jgi:hypothetical protein
MSLRRKGQLFILVGFMVGPLLIWLSMSSRVSPNLLLAFVVVYTSLAFILRCPVCRKPIMWNPLCKVGRLRIFSWTVEIPRKCSRCGASLE